MVMLSMKMMERLAALWTAGVAFVVAHCLIRAYRGAPEPSSVIALVTHSRLSPFRVLPRIYLIVIAVPCVLIGVGCLIAGFSKTPSTRPPLFRHR